MSHPGLAGPEDELIRRVRALEARVSSLEQRMDAGVAASGSNPDTAAEPAREAWNEAIPTVTAVGRALLGVAGAYVLRAATESQVVPQRVGVFTAVVYAMLWLMGAARGRVSGRMERAIYALTSAAILAPLLWESTLRLHAISTWTSAALLFAVTLFGRAIAWRRNLPIISRIGTLAGVLTGTAFLVSAHDVVPFLAVLFGIAGAVEVSACLHDQGNERWIAAAGADLGLMLVMYLITLPRGLPESYASIPRLAVVAALIALPGVYLSTALFRTLRRRLSLGFFGGGQLAITVLMAVGGGVWLGDSKTGLAIGTACVAGAIACYAAFSMSNGPSFYVYLGLGFLLGIAGLRLLLAERWTAAACVGLAFIFLRARNPALRWCGAGYLLLALVFSGGLAQAGGWLLGSSHDLTAILPLAVGAAAALACFGLSVRDHGQPVLTVVLGGVGFLQSAGLGAAVLCGAYHMALGASAPHAYCATFRTVVLAAGAVLISWAGTHRKGLQATPLIYPILVLGAYRLLMLDLRQDSKTALVLSLLAYGAALILVPRLGGSRQTATR